MQLPIELKSLVKENCLYITHRLVAYPIYTITEDQLYEIISTILKHPTKYRSILREQSLTNEREEFLKKQMTLPLDNDTIKPL